VADRDTPTGAWVSLCAARIEPETDALLRAVEEAAARQHGAGYGSRHKGRRCNLARVYGCLFCRTLVGLENAPDEPEDRDGV
jgi:hypothetical protein